MNSAETQQPDVKNVQESNARNQLVSEVIPKSYVLIGIAVLDRGNVTTYAYSTTEQ